MIRVVAYVSVLLCLLMVTIETKEVGDDYSIRESDQKWLDSLFYLPTEPRVRKEYRMLTDEERYQFNDAFVKMKNDRSVIPNKYDLISSIHSRRSTRNSAHRGTGFLGWHRVYTLLMENALREWYPNITMAYWDTTLDAVLGLPRESSLWSEDFMGNGDGYVLEGVFKGWSVQNGELYRTVGALYGPLADKNISHLLQQDHIGNISYPLQGKNVENVFEEIHNRVHHFVGGEMKVIETAADDPVFFPYHSFVSYIWEEFRSLQRMKGIDPETDWDEYYGQARHHKYSPMGLGNLMAIDGSSEIFAENIVFTDRPSCSRENPDCGSPHLYCNVTMEKCCPWTVKEYNIIKQAGSDNHIPFKEAAIPFIESKVNKGYWQVSKLENGTDLAEYGDPFPAEQDLFRLMEEQNVNKSNDLETDQYGDQFFNDYLETELDYNDDHEHGPGDHDHTHDDHDHTHDDIAHTHDGIAHTHDDHEHSHEGHEHPHEGHEHTHEGHEHPHGHVIKGGRQIHYVASIENVFPIYFAVIALAALTGIRIVFIIVSKCVAENCNKGSRSKKYRMDGIVNANYSDDKNKKNQTTVRENRCNNIYTVTVTTNGQPSPEHNGTFVRFEQYAIDNTGKISVKPTSTERQASTISDYLDMTYASHSSTEGTVEHTTHTAIYENDRDSGDYENDEVDRSYNSIENENFDFTDLTCEAVIETDGQKSEDSFDVFDAYDNFVFKREAADIEKSQETGKIASDDASNANYLPGTRL
ncbi:uncharacterized protein LOC123548569 [Mercenaria mercenaria]|uniref:uncharacterized protein LOC123548569 n=1 Tax=Mercenaria mercenaria TaxID=6596 RepID=UPI00234F567A|nr:uncharacterized protein LOC123548569 [Mercenaria mercenaria]